MFRNERKETLVYCRLFCCYRRIRFVFGSFFFLMYIFLSVVFWLRASNEIVLLGVRVWVHVRVYAVQHSWIINTPLHTQRIRAHFMQHSIYFHWSLLCIDTFSKYVLPFLALVETNQTKSMRLLNARTISFNDFLFLLFINCTFHTHDFISFFLFFLSCFLHCLSCIKQRSV